MSGVEYDPTTENEDETMMMNKKKLTRHGHFNQALLQPHIMAVNSMK